MSITRNRFAEKIPTHSFKTCSQKFAKAEEELGKRKSCTAKECSGTDSLSKVADSNLGEAKVLLSGMKVARRKAVGSSASDALDGVRVGKAERRKIHRLEAPHTGDDQVQADNHGAVEANFQEPATDPANLDLPGSPEEGKDKDVDTWEAELTSKGAKQRANLEKKAKEAVEAAKKKGVVYLSRVPPHMKPQKLRHLLSQYGDLGRLYLAPEDPGVRRRRKKLKGNTGKNFSEGWVEFLDKKAAKRVAAMLNGNPMGGKRRSAYHYDIWCLKYLPKFKWDFLTEEIAYQNAVREQKLAAEISAAKRERDFYLSRVDRAKAADARQKRQMKRAVEGLEGQKTGGAVGAPRIVRSYNQKMAKPDPTADADAPVLSQDVLALLAGKR